MAAWFRWRVEMNSIMCWLSQRIVGATAWPKRASARNTCKSQKNSIRSHFVRSHISHSCRVFRICVINRFAHSWQFTHSSRQCNLSWPFSRLATTDQRTWTAQANHLLPILHKMTFNCWFRWHDIPECHVNLLLSMCSCSMCWIYAINHQPIPVDVMSFTMLWHSKRRFYVHIKLISRFVPRNKCASAKA